MARRLGRLGKPLFIILMAMGFAGLATGPPGAPLTPSAAHAQPQPPPDEAVAQLIRAALLGYFDPASSLAVSVASSRMSGDALVVGQLTVDGRPAYLRGIQGEFLLQVADLEIDAAALAQQQVKVRRVRAATLVARSTAAAMAQALARASPAILDPRVRFHAGEFEVTATVRREGRTYPTQARGRLVVDQGRIVRVAVTSMKVAGGDVPESTIERELLRINPILDLSRYPLDLRIQRLTLHNDRIELLAVGGR